MPQTLYVASSNAGKLRDFAVAASAHGITILPLPSLASITAPPEDAPTFLQNARDKAEYYSRFLPTEMVLSDDSGLEVDFLKGAPGIRSARYAADAGFHEVDAVDANNNQFLLRSMTGVADGERSGRYQCALAVAQDGATRLTAAGTVEGTILRSPRGNGGFGYDPLFFLPNLGKAMAELDDESRWALSHRGIAFRALLEQLEGVSR